MIDFKPVRPEDRAAIERFTLRSETENCDFAFANMYCWRFLYDSRWAVVEGFLVVRFRIGGGGRLGYMQPLGPGDFVSVLPQLEADARAHGQRLRLAGLDEAACAHLRSAAGEEYALASDPATDDYVYDAEALRTLPGRRYQSKRNHINRFLSLWPDYRYEALTPDRFAECLRLERRWRAEHADRPASELGAEQRAMQEAFDRFETLGLTGGCLYAGDTLVAFTFGSAVNEHTFDTHVEKADTNYDGAFALINRTFAEHLPARYTRINRDGPRWFG